MKDRLRLFFVTAWMLAGCASVPAPPAATSTVPAAISQQSGEAVIVEPVPKPVMSANPAVIALLDRAQLDAAAGKRDVAGASIERGLRIEPRNAWLWQELAQLRLAQGLYAQAISLAQKSISFAGRDRRLLVLDWRVIGNARVAQGNPAEADKAFKLATELESAAQSDQSAARLFGTP